MRPSVEEGVSVERHVWSEAGAEAVRMEPELLTRCIGAVDPRRCGNDGRETVSDVMITEAALHVDESRAVAPMWPFGRGAKA